MNKSLLLAALLAAAPIAANAGELSYNFIEAGAARVDVDGFDKMDGFQVRGSFAINPSWYVHGGYGRVNNDDYGVDLDLEEAQIGAGYRLPLSERADFINELTYVRQEVTVDDGLTSDSASASGTRFSTGFRGLLGTQGEGWIKASYTGGSDFDGFSGLIGAQFKFTPNWGVVAEVEADQDITKVMVGVRASF